MKHTISILCDDTPGVMTRISALFSRRGFNIESLSVGHSEKKAKSRFTIVVNGDDRVLEQIRKQLQKLIHVIKVWDIKPHEGVEREHALIKLKVPAERQTEILQVVTSLHARIIDSHTDTWILEVTGEAHAVNNAFNILSAYPIVESIRTGKIAFERFSKQS